MKNKECRAFDFDIRSERRDDNTGVLTGVPIVFNARTDLGYFDEVIDAHALDNADLRDVRFLVNHDTTQLPLARSRNNNANSTMQMSVEEDGMHIRVDLDVEGNTRAKDLYSAVNRGDVSGMSFMFTVEGDNWEGLDGDHPTRTITSIGRVMEVSAVTFPAYEATSINARAAETLESAKATLESVRRADELAAWKTRMKEIQNGNL